MRYNHLVRSSSKCALPKNSEPLLALMTKLTSMSPLVSVQYTWGKSGKLHPEHGVVAFVGVKCQGGHLSSSPPSDPCKRTNAKSKLAPVILETLSMYDTY